MSERLEQEGMSFFIFLPKLSQPKREVQWGRQIFIHMELSSWLIKQRKTKLLSGALQLQVNQTKLFQVSGNPKGALNSFKMHFWKLGVLTMPEILNRSPVSLVPSERQEVWLLKVLLLIQQGSEVRSSFTPGVQQCCYELAVLTFSPGFRPKHTLQPAHLCFADHRPQDEILVASWKSNIIRMLPWS